MRVRVSSNVPSDEDVERELARAVYTYNKPPKKISEFSWPICGVATLFCIYKGFVRKIQRKKTIRPILLLFLQKRSNQLNSLARMLHLYSSFSRHPYWPHLLPYWPYDDMAIRPDFGHTAIFAFGHIV